MSNHTNQSVFLPYVLQKHTSLAASVARAQAKYIATLQETILVLSKDFSSQLINLPTLFFKSDGRLYSWSIDEVPGFDALTNSFISYNPNARLSPNVDSYFQINLFIHTDQISYRQFKSLCSTNTSLASHTTTTFSLDSQGGYYKEVILPQILASGRVFTEDTDELGCFTSEMVQEDFYLITAVLKYVRDTLIQYLDIRTLSDLLKQDNP